MCEENENFEKFSLKFQSYIVNEKIGNKKLNFKLIK